MVLYQSSNLPNDDLPKQKPHELDPWESQQKKNMSHLKLLNMDDWKILINTF